MSDLLSFILLSLFILFFFFLLCKWLYFIPATRENRPPSPPKLPFLGNLHQLGAYPHRSLHSLSCHYGELMLMHFGTTPTLVVSSANAAKQVMKTQDIIFANRPNPTRTSSKLLYNGKDVSFAPYGDYWRNIKSICTNHLLSNQRVRSFRRVREEETVFLMDKIKKTTTVVNMSELFMTFTNDVICRVAFGKKYSEKEGRLEFKELLKELIELLGSFKIGDFMPWFGWLNWVSGWDARVDRVASKFDSFLEEIVTEHQLGRPKEGRIGEDGEKMKDFVDVLLEVQKENMGGIDRDSIKALILDMFSGGTDTTYTVLEWAMTELLRHPKVMKQLQREVREHTNGKPRINEDDLEQMNYLKSVIKETLRLHPPIPLLPRKPTQDVKINGYDIPSGTSVIVNAWAIHRDPSSWEEPEVFNPDRFAKSATDYKGQDFELIPFGAGRRGCPGIMFAIANSQLVLANLMYKFDWVLPVEAKAETLDMTECIGLTIHRKNSLLVVAREHYCE